MNLLFLLSNFQDGGIETVAIEYMNNIVRTTEHKVTLGIALNMLNHEVFLDRLDERVRVLHFINNRILTFRRRNRRNKHKKNAFITITDEVFFNPIRRYVINRSIKKSASEYDAVIDFDFMQSAYMKNFASIKKIAFYHFSLSRNLKTEKDKKRFFNRAKHYDRIVLLCDSMLEEAKQLFPEMASKFCKIYNAMNPAQLQKRAEMEIPHEFESLTTEPFMVAVSRLSETQKDLTTLISAFGIYQNEHKERSIKRLLIIGEGDSHAALQKHIDDLGLSEQVHLIGFVANPQPFIKKAEIMVHSAKFEGLPTVLIEALMLGKLIISTDCPVGPREILDYGKSGMLVPVGDAQAFADTMHELLTNEAKQAELKAVMAEHRNWFLPETSIGKLEELLR